MEAQDWADLQIGDVVRIMDYGRYGRVADKISEIPGVYTVLVEIGKNGKRPLFLFASLDKIRRQSI